MACEHNEFESIVDIARLTDDDGGPVVGYQAEIKVRCSECGEPFCWRGLGLGMSHMEPRVSVDGTELRAPIHPMSDPTTGIGLPGFDVRVRG